MTILLWINPTIAGRSRYRSGGAQWPHVGECAFAGMVEQCDGGRVSAAGGDR